MFPKLRSSPWFSLAPALTLISVLLGASLLYAIAESLGLISVLDQSAVSLEAWRKALAFDSEFWVSLVFSLWVSVVSTIIASMLALLVAVWLAERRTGSETLALNWNLAFPHLVWATALVLFLSQSGLLARWAAALGWITTTDQFPILIR
ncbi:MAG: hypothetical protein M3Y68_08420, partial [Chloroflexota bacterium]|nr:hypothetical protein [Chloroflexota bacterium]